MNREQVEAHILEVGADTVRRMSDSNPIRIMWEGAPPERRQDMAQALFYKKEGMAGPAVHVGAPTAAYKAELLLGKKPVELVPSLTEKHANMFMQQGEHETPLNWLWSHAKTIEPELKSASQPGTIAVVYWTLRMLQSPRRREAMLRHRTGVFGDNVEGRVLDRLDEIKPQDLSSSPVRTLETAVERAVREEWNGDDQLIKDEGWHQEMPEGVTVLTTYKALRSEGISMRHCVSSYANRVAGNEMLILSIDDRHGRSTVAVSPTGDVTQHKGPHNAEPCAEHREIAAESGKIIQARARV